MDYVEALVHEQDAVDPSTCGRFTGWFWRASTMPTAGQYRQLPVRITGAAHQPARGMGGAEPDGRLGQLAGRRSERPSIRSCGPHWHTTAWRSFIPSSTATVARPAW